MASPRTIYLLFCLSGVSSLIFEVVWTRLLLRSMGANVLSTACVLSAFMAGLSLGACIADKRTLAGKPLKTWAWAELACASFGIFLPWFLSGNRLQVFSAMMPGETDDFLSGATRFLIAFSILLIPSTAMGTGYPLLANFLRSLNAKTNAPHGSTGAGASAGEVASLYAANVTGAMAGSITGGFFLLPLFGPQTTSWIAAAISLTIFVTIQYIDRSILQTGADKHQYDHPRSPNLASSTAGNLPNETDAIMARGSSPAEQADGIAPTEQTNGRGCMAIVVALSGATVMLQELIWTRMFATVFGSSVYSTGTIFFLVLAGMSIGAWIVANSVRRKASSLSLPLVLVASATTALLTAYGSDYLPQALLIATRLTVRMPVNETLAFILVRGIVALPIVLPATIFSGMIFPLSVYQATWSKTNRLYMFSCIGSATGAMISGSILLPYLFRHFNNALNTTSIIASAVFFLSALIVAASARSGKNPARIFAAGTALVAGIAAILLIPPQTSQSAQSAGVCYYDSQSLAKLDMKALSPKVVFYEEGLNATVSITRTNNTLALRSNGKVEATLPVDCRLIAPGCDISTHTLLGALPMILQENPTDALLIGYGSGITSDALLSFGLLKSLTVAELEAAIIRARKEIEPFSRQYFPTAPAISPDFRINDGRYILASSSRKWDIVVCQAAEPRTADAADLYTKEFWQLVRSRLTDRGICSQWIQLYAMPRKQLLSVIKTFQSVFPNAMLCHSPGAGEIILLGLLDEKPPLKHQINERILRSAKTSIALAYCGVTSLPDFLALFKVNSRGLKELTVNSSLNLDDSTTLEFDTGALLAPPDDLITANYECLTGNLEIPFDLLTGSIDYRLTSSVASALAGFASNGALGDKKDADLAKRMAEQAASRLPCPQTQWNALRIDLAEQAAFDNSAFELLKQSKIEKPPDHLALAQIAFLQGDVCKNSTNHPGAPRLSKGELLRSACTAAVNRARIEVLRAQDDPLLASEINLLKGWLKSDISEEATNHFTKSLNQRPNWFPALLGLALSTGNPEQREIICSQMLGVDPWNPTAHLLMTKCLITQGKFQQAMSHATNAATITGEGDGFIMLLSAEPGRASQILRVFRRYAPDDSRLAKLQEKAGQPGALNDLSMQMETRSAKAGVSGYKKLGFP